MKLFLVLLAVIACSLAATVPQYVPVVPFEESLRYNQDFADGMTRIHNGHAAAANQFPYQVSLRIPIGAGMSVCGGSVVSGSWVLSAAHCTTGRAQINLRFGSINQLSGGVAQTSFRIVNHPNFNPVNLNNDVSLIHIPTPLSFSAAIQAVRLPTAGQASATFAGLQTVVSGFGEAVPGGGAQTLLRWVNTRVIPNAQCASTFGTSSVVGHVVCTLGYANPNQGVCGGDSGGPLVLIEGGVPTQIGVVAFGAAPILGGCAGGHPSGYMRTASFLGWVNQHTGIAVRG